MKTKRIGLVADFRYTPPATDGITVFSGSLIKALNELDSPFHFTVFINDHHRHLVADLGENFSVEPIKSFSRNEFTDICWFFFRLPILARKHSIDLLHLFSGDRRLSMFPFRRTVVSVHDTYYYKYRKENPLKKHLFFRYILSSLLKTHPQIVTVSRHVRAEIHKKIKAPLDKIYVIPNSFSKEHFFPMNDRCVKQEVLATFDLKKRFILYVSNLDHPKKNHINLIKAYAEFDKSCPQAPELVLVGKRMSGFSVIRETIKQMSLKKIKILGAVSVKQLAALYNCARFFVHPSRFEGFGLPIIEAMACGVPVTCSNLPVFREVTGGNALFFDPLNPDSIFGALQKLNSNGKIRKRLSANGLKYVQNYSWEKTARDYVSVYESILNGVNCKNKVYNDCNE